MKYKYIILLIIVSVTLINCHSSKGHDDHSAPHEGSHHQIGTLEVSTGILVDTIYYSEYVSQIRAHQHIELKALEKGYLHRLLVDEGQQVKKGQLLFEIQPTIYLAEIDKSQAEVHHAEAEKTKVLNEYNNTKALADNNIVSTNELALVKSELQSAEAKVGIAKAELNLMKAHLQFTQIRAPFDGIIGQFEDVRLGALIEEGEKLTTLTDNNKMWVYFNVPESVYLDYAENPSEVGAIQLKLANNKLFGQQGKITAIEAEFDNTTGTIPFRATFENPQRLLRHGQTGNILWPHHMKNALLIPQKSTYEVLEKRYVYVVDSEGHVASREIKISAEFDNLYAISSGINKDDRFLIEGLRKVKNGDKIEVEYKPAKEVMAHLNLHAE